MFEFIRKHNKIMMVLMFLLIIPSFVLFGIDGYRKSAEKGATVAEVDGHGITQGEWDAAHQANVERIRAQNPTADAKLLDGPEARYATLENLLHERVLQVAANKANLAPSDAQLARVLQQDPNIAAMRDATGKLDVAQYRAVLAAQGMTPEGYEARVRADLALRQLQDSVAGTAFATPAQADVALNAFFEKRDIQVALFKPQDFAAQVTASDADLETYYKDHQAQFRLPEQASVEYVVLDMDAVKKTVAVSEQDLRTYYEQNQAMLAGKEERRASHILITAAKDAPAADRAKAKARAQEILAAVRKNPAQFAELAKKNSQDTGSAVQGGDLGFFPRGAMVKPFEDTVFAQKKGDISDLVESDFGYHIIQLTDIKAAKQPSFEEVRAKLEGDLRQQEAQKKFAEAAETFTNTVYEQADSLKPVADKLKLTIQTASGVARIPAPGVTGALATPRLLEALFAPDATEKKRNTEAVEIGPNQLASARIVQYTAARTPAFADVRDKVRTQLVAQRAAELARKQGEAKLAAWKKNPAEAAMPVSAVVSRDPSQQQQPAQPQAVVDAALRAPVATLPAFAGVDTGAAYAVVRINKVQPRVPDASKAPQERGQVAQGWGAAENQAYYKLLKARYKATIKVSKPAGIVAG
ncbi:MAG: SurA N-terminal domain-containing protein [Pseudomonadota bacterium]